MIVEPPPGSICRDRLGQAWHSRTDHPFGWQRTGSGLVTPWDGIPPDLRRSMVLLSSGSETRPSEGVGPRDVDRCNAPLLVRDAIDGVLMTCGQAGGMEWTSIGPVALSTLLERARDHRDWCQAGPVR